MINKILNEAKYALKKSQEHTYIDVIFKTKDTSLGKVRISLSTLEYYKKYENDCLTCPESDIHKFFNDCTSLKINWIKERKLKI